MAPDPGELSSWRAAQGAAISAGWTLEATGDWSWLYRSADGDRAWKITPFDPAFRAFAEVCRYSSNVHLPRLEGIHDHAEGGYSVIMEWLDPVTKDEAEAWFAELNSATDGDLVELRHLLADTAAGVKLPLFAGVDENPDNVLRRPSDGSLVFTDAYWIDGPVLYEMIHTNPQEALALYPTNALEQWAHLPCMDAAATASILAAIDR